MLRGAISSRKQARLDGAVLDRPILFFFAAVSMTRRISSQQTHTCASSRVSSTDVRAAPRARAAAREPGQLSPARKARRASRLVSSRPAGLHGRSAHRHQRRAPPRATISRFRTMISGIIKVAQTGRPIPAAATNRHARSRTPRHVCRCQRAPPPLARSRSRAARARPFVRIFSVENARTNYAATPLPPNFPLPLRDRPCTYEAHTDRNTGDTHLARGHVKMCCYRCGAPGAHARHHAPITRSGRSGRRRACRQQRAQGPKLLPKPKPKPRLADTTAPHGSITLKCSDGRGKATTD